MGKRNWLKRLFGKPRIKDAMALRGIARARRFDPGDFEDIKNTSLAQRLRSFDTDLTLLPAQNSVALGEIALDWIPYSLLDFPKWWRWN